MAKPRIIAVKPLEGLQIEIVFGDGAQGVLDFSLLSDRAGFYSELRDPAYFRQVRINEDGTLEWPGGLDLCPDVLHHLVAGSSLPGGGWLDDPGIRVLSSQPR